MDISEKASIKAHPDVLVKQVGDSCVLLNLKTESYYGLDAIGYAFYSALIGSKDLQAAHLSLLEEYEVESTELKKDLQELISELLKAQVVCIENA